MTAQSCAACGTLFIDAGAYVGTKGARYHFECYAQRQAGADSPLAIIPDVETDVCDECLTGMAECICDCGFSI